MLPAGNQDDAPISTAGVAGSAPLDESKRSFLRVVSHELRTPLNSILGFSEIIATELHGPLGSDKYREYAEIIHRSGEKLLRLVNQVVEIARFQSGDLELDIRPESLAPILAGLSEGLHETLAARRLQLLVPPCGEIEALADGRTLRALLQGL